MTTESNHNDKRTLVEEGTHLKGSITSSCPVLVKGKIEGDVGAPALTVSPSGAVHGKAKVGELSAEGELSGEFDADVVQLSGKVQDRTVIRTKTLSVKLASENRLQVVFGECELAVGDPPPPPDAT
jgi:cytoskeletal protein CcmA (bactofilin family)